MNNRVRARARACGEQVLNIIENSCIYKKCRRRSTSSRACRQQKQRISLCAWLCAAYEDICRTRRFICELRDIEMNIDAGLGDMRYREIIIRYTKKTNQKKKMFHFPDYHYHYFWVRAKSAVTTQALRSSSSSRKSAPYYRGAAAAGEVIIRYQSGLHYITDEHYHYCTTNINIITFTISITLRTRAHARAGCARAMNIRISQWHRIPARASAL